MAFDPLETLRTLTGHGVRFVVIGGIAGRLWGSPTVTGDLDICYARDDENLDRLATALRVLDARLRDVDDDVPFVPDAETLRRGDSFTFSTRTGNLDAFGTPMGTSGYDDLVEAAVEMDLDGVRILVANVEDLIRLKRAVGRPKDLIEVEVLEAVRDELRGQGET